MATPEELIECNGKLVEILTFDDELFVGILQYTPLNGDYSVAVLEDSCCIVALMMPEDIDYLYCDDIPPTPVIQPCCGATSLPLNMLMTISNISDSSCSCLADEAYILEWDNNKKVYQINLYNICDCNIFHAELRCVGSDWVAYVSLSDGVSVCADTNGKIIAMNCDTMVGSDVLSLESTGSCTCGTCNTTDFTATFIGIY